MTDLLGSILGSMEKPPVIEDKEKKRAREQKALLEKQQQQERQKLNQFRSQIQKRIAEFVNDGALQKLAFQPMNKVERSIVHEVTEVAGLTSFSFGEEDIDRHIVVWKKEFAPCDAELNALRNDQEWDPEKAKLASAEKQEARQATTKRKHHGATVPDGYHRKYEHLLGKESAKDAARATSANKSYGFVPSENKRDVRTIEQVMAESRAKKKLKTDGCSESSSSTAQEPAE